ncbi:hypothetical protein [Nubsella zeaxanthinifaciens]|uniref:hypothetical protein n=1 Tax=Nubsella zeaxanthinifaciens TaxID=392412 RepID=UPI001300BDB3|nr:hypothetical protein [Nubsella zeaxanthinifaciens]
MKNMKFKTIQFILLLVVIFASCKKKDELDRSYEAAKIVGVKINNELFTPSYNANVASVVVPAGRDLSKVKLQVLVANGEVIDFENNQIRDVRKPLNLSLKGSNGEDINTVLKIQSPPLLSTFIIEGLNIPKADVHFSSTSLIVQVPKNTNLTNLKVTMDFVNGTLVDFTNGQAADYSTQKTFKVKGADGETIYSYDFIITTEQVGPASVRSMTINGIATDSVVFVAPSTIIPYVKGITDFSKATVTIAAGFGNRIDPSFTGTNLNLLTLAEKVKITGSDGIEKQFTIGVPQLSLKPVFSKDYAAFGYPANDLVGIAFSGSNIVVANYSATAPTVVGPNYYDLAGNQVGVLNKTGVVIANSLRKVATDSKGVILAVSLGLTTVDQTIYKWDNVTAAPVPYITYSSASLGLGTTAFRAAGINVSGSLDGNAIITVARAQSTDVFVWTVTAGVLNPTPTKYAFPYAATGFYYSIEPMPIGTPGFIGAATGTNFNGIIALGSTMDELGKTSGLSASDCKIYKLDNRIYLGFVVYSSGKGAYFRLADITDNKTTSVQNPIMNVLMPSTAANANVTMDVDIAKVNGKLHAVFACTNIGMQLYKLEQ